MRVRVPFAAALAACLVAPVLADDKKNDADLKAMVGKWTVEKSEMGGKNLSEFLKNLKFEIAEGGKYTTELGEVKDEGTFTIDAAKAPKAMDITPTAGANKGKTIRAVYALDGDSLVVCYALDGGARPEKLESKAGTMHLLTTYKRVKK